MIPEVITGERTIRLRGVTDEASCGMGIQRQEEDNEKVMRIPKCFERLLPKGCVRGRIH
jgi:hypothetical protein